PAAAEAGVRGPGTGRGARQRGRAPGREATGWAGGGRARVVAGGRAGRQVGRGAARPGEDRVVRVRHEGPAVRPTRGNDQVRSKTTRRAAEMRSIVSGSTVP